MRAEFEMMDGHHDLIYAVEAEAAAYNNLVRAVMINLSYRLYAVLRGHLRGG